MSERYYSKDYDELYYIFDSHTVSEEAVDERIEYDGYNAFEDSLTDKEILKLLNENEELKYNLYDHMVDLNNYTGKCSALEIENEQLRHDATILIQSNQDYRKENEELKQQLKELKAYNNWLVSVLEDSGAIVEIKKSDLNEDL